MAGQTCITISESFVSKDENERRENVQRAMDEYAALCAKGRGLSGKGPDKE